MFRRDIYIKRNLEKDNFGDYSFFEDFHERKDGKITAYSVFCSHDYEDKYDKHNRYKYYTKLTSFMKNAEYIGKKFKRTKQTQLAPGKFDRSYMEEIKLGDYSLIVLYATSDLILIQETSISGDVSYEMLDPRYFRDGNFSFYGEQVPQTKSKEDIILEIIDQTERYKEKQKQKIRK